MGLLDLPAPLLGEIDLLLAALLPPVVRVVLWAALGALLSMELYRLLSPQGRIAALKLELRGAQQRVAGFDGELAEAWPLLRRMLGLALKRIALVLPATLAASLPLLVVVIWLDGSYGGAYPAPGRAVAVEVDGAMEGRWIEGANGEPPRAAVLDAQGGTVAEVPIQAPVPVIEKRHWWNLLIGNPAGYLPDDLPVERLELDLPRQEIVGLGPAWLRGWEPAFFLALVVFAVALKAARRIQ